MAALDSVTRVVAIMRAGTDSQVDSVKLSGNVKPFTF